MANINNWVKCDLDSCDRPGTGAASGTQDCSLSGWPTTVDLAPTATQGTGTVTLTVGDFTALASSDSSCTFDGVDVANVQVGGVTPGTSPIVMDSTTKVITYDSASTDIVTFEVVASATKSSIGTWTFGAT